MLSILKSAFNSTKISLILICFITFILCLLTIQEGHNWGGDFAMYIHQAKAITNGSLEQLYQQNILLTENSSVTIGPYLYPNGFPLILSVVYKTFGLNLYLFKLISATFLVLTLPIIYKLSTAFFEKIIYQYLSVILIGFNAQIILFTDNVLSDLPFFFFSILSIFLFKKQQTIFGAVLLGVAIFYTYFTRDIGIILLPTLLVYQLFSYKKTAFNKLKLAIPYVVFLLLVTASKFIFPFESNGNHFEILLNITLVDIATNIAYYAFLVTNYFTIIAFEKKILMLPFVILIMPIIGVGILQIKRSNLYLLAYVLFHFTILFIWPFHEGIRFILPTLPFLVFFFISGIIQNINHTKKPQLIKNILLSYTALSIFLSLFTLLNERVTKKTNEAYTQEIQLIYQYISKNINADDTVAFRKPRVLRLFANINTASVKQDEFENSVAKYYLVADSAITEVGNRQFRLQKKFRNHSLFTKQ